jgi:hypothetical protein
MTAMDICIEHGWNGGAIEVNEQVRIAVVGDHMTGLNITVNAPYWGDAAPSGPQGRRWQLWEHEVVELFLVGADGHYLEFEFGPHGHYLALKLDAPRQVSIDDLQIDYEAEIMGKRWTARSLIPSRFLPSPILKYNAFAIHGTGHARRYLAHSPVPGSQPDFHQPHHFPTWPHETKRALKSGKNNSRLPSPQ